LSDSFHISFRKTGVLQKQIKEKKSFEEQGRPSGASTNAKHATG
jgi:hypothetical protein